MAKAQAAPTRSIELFTGAGGLALATHQAGFAHAALVEWNHDACDTLRENVRSQRIPSIGSWNVLETDVRALNFRQFGTVDLVAGGPPCQPFSIGGKHKGMADERNMIPHYIRAVREVAPKAFLFENVRGLTRQSFKNYFEYTVLQLTYPELTPQTVEDPAQHLSRLENLHTCGTHNGLRYNVVFRVLNAADYGVPQNRYRVFVVGFRADLKCEWHFPEPTHSLEALLYDQWVTGSYWQRHGIPQPRHVPASLAAKVAKLGPLAPPTTKPWQTIRDAICDLPQAASEVADDSGWNHRIQPGARSYPGHTGSPVDMPSKTLKAGDHGVPGGENTVLFPDREIRYLTVREAARIQTFPDGWRFCGAWSEAMRQLGNAVPVELAGAVARSVANKLAAIHE